MQKLNLIIGPMFSGKTSLLLSKYKRYTIADKKCLLVKFYQDTRYDNLCVVTHDNIKENAISIKKLSEIDDIVQNYDVVLIDEIQFYDDAFIYCNKWANFMIVEACGLNGDYKQEPFEQISLLIPIADNIQFLTAIDKTNGNDAPFTIRLTNDDKQIVIGGNQIYEARSRISLN